MLVRPAENKADGFGVQFLRPEPACVAVLNHACVTNVTPSLVAHEKGPAVMPIQEYAFVSLMAKLRTKSLIVQNLGNMELSAS
jgi:hypothetical protein